MYAQKQFSDKIFSFMSRSSEAVFFISMNTGDYAYSYLYIILITLAETTERREENIRLLYISIR